MELAAIGTVLAALGAVIKIVLDAIGKQDDRHSTAMTEQRAGFEKFLGNHMSKNTAALNDMAMAVKLLREEIERHSGPEYRHK